MQQRLTRTTTTILAVLTLAALHTPIFAGTGLTFANELRKFAPSDGEVDDHYGSDVVIDGDLMVIGSREDEPGTGSNLGSIYVYRRTAGDWAFEQKLEANVDDQVDFAMLGISVDVDASAGVIVGGASSEDHFLDGGTVIRRAGAAYVFRHNGVEWVQEQRLTASDAFKFDAFGRDVTVEGDRIVVGAHEEGTACDDSQDDFILQNCNSGAAYVFEFDGSRWNETAKLVASDTAARDLFGESVELQGDVIAVGSWNAGNLAEPGCLPACADTRGHGAVYVFRYDGVNWNEEAILFGDDPTDGSWDNFGSDVEMSGEWLIAGERYDDDAAENAGAAYIFRNPGGQPGVWNFEAKLVPPDGALGDFLGDGADIEDDIAVVSAIGDDIDGLSSVGSAYVWKRINDVWTFQGKLIASDGNAIDFGGNWLSIENNQVAVGVNLNDSTAAEAGAVYLYGSLGDCDADGVLDLFEIASGAAEDTNGDGTPDACQPSCPADIADDDGVVNVFDLLGLLSNWGSDGPGADLAEPNDVVNVFDLLELLASWGECP